MKTAQLIFRFLCLAVAVVQFGILVNKAFLEVDYFETTDIEFSDSDNSESDSENSLEEVPVLSFLCDNLFISQDFNFAFLLTRKKIHFLRKKIVSQTPSVPFSPPELEI
jgi:hypothetical protein